MANYIGDQYCIRRKISRDGNMSTVYLCKDDFNKEFAIKVFDKHVGNEETEKLQEIIFSREVETLQKVQHPNIVKIHDHDIDDKLEKFYIVLEYVDGKNFNQAFEDLCNYDEYSKLELIDQVLSGVEYLHKKNIVHRDLKPSNIMFNSDGVVKIIDFGISKLADTFYSEYTVGCFSTPRYRSPEQSQGKEITNQSDIYSLGLIFYEIFKKEKLADDTVMDVSNLPEGIQDILAKMLKTEISLRYKTVIDIRNDIAVIKTKIVQNKFLTVGITKNVSKMLFQYDFILREELAFAVATINKDLAGRIFTESKKDDKGDCSYHIYGKQFELICRRDNFNSQRLTIIHIRFPNSAELNRKKEYAFEIPYRINVQASALNGFAKNEIEADVLIDEVMKYEIEKNDEKEDRLRCKDIAGKWKTILGLHRKKLEKEKANLGYRDFKVHDAENYIEVYLDKEVFPDSIQFAPDDMLQMTARSNPKREYNVGYMRDYYKGVMIVDLAANTDPENIASVGDISINMHMVEISLKRQEQALKSIRFKENCNPKISDIIFNPEKATSKNNELLSPKECHSSFIDESKLKSLEKALSADDIFLLQGPPGTGKTTFISELVCQILIRNPESKILIASQSHVAVDHSLTKIKELMPSIKLIRVGIKEKFSDSVINYTLDAFCKEWTENVILRCKTTIEEYKKEIGLDESLQEKNAIVLEIERLMQSVSTLINEMNTLEKEKEKIDVLNSKWEYINETISGMKNIVKTKTNNVSEQVLLDIVDTFSNDLTSLNSLLGHVLDESIQLSAQKETLERRFWRINIEMEETNKDIISWKELLGVSPKLEDYEKAKAEVENALKENQTKYNKFAKIEALCKEWATRVKQGDGLLQESLIDATVVGATCLGVASLSNNVELQFDWVIVDEAGKATPTEILVPICLGKKIVLVGDHKQLPPVVDETLLNMDNTGISKADLETSLFEYLENSLNENCKSILNEQYRMNPIIGELISQMFYKETPLISKTKKEEKSIPLKMYDEKPLVWLSTARRSDNKEEKLGITYRNNCEAKIIFEQLLQIDNELGKLKLFKEVAIIAGYKAQKELIRSIYNGQYEVKLHHMKVEINTVDAFQGRETDIVFYSVVRSNDEGRLGFLQDVRRLNVAFSRARELLVVVGNHHSATKQINIDNQENPFVGIITYIYSHEDDCILKEVE